uniref:Uncharacterized protein n=1 Tax=Knipowitschia caucasica TaxID=637954 RepID=A0AAV2KV09_KNICA
MVVVRVHSHALTNSSIPRSSIAQVQVSILRQREQPENKTLLLLRYLHTQSELKRHELKHSEALIFCREERSQPPPEGSADCGHTSSRGRHRIRGELLQKHLEDEGPPYWPPVRSSDVRLSMQIPHRRIWTRSSELWRRRTWTTADREALPDKQQSLDVSPPRSDSSGNFTHGTWNLCPDGSDTGARCCCGNAVKRSHGG